MKVFLAVLATVLFLAAGVTAASGHGKPKDPPGGGHTPVEICHKPGTPAEQTLIVDDDAVPGHLGHGDYLGPCQSSTTGGTDGGTTDGGGTTGTDGGTTDGEGTTGEGTTGSGGTTDGGTTDGGGTTSGTDGGTTDGAATTGGTGGTTGDTGPVQPVGGIDKHPAYSTTGSPRIERASKELPYTGFSVLPLVLLGGGLVAAGGALMLPNKEEASDR